MLKIKSQNNRNLKILGKMKVFSKFVSKTFSNIHGEPLSSKNSKEKV
jgi:hypothetical protein